MPWITDAQLAGSLDEADTHQTQDIRRFLARGNEQQFIIVASKGMGKTTLMRLKREQLQKAEEGLTLIPFNDETDIVSLPSSPDRSLLSALREEPYWRALWQTAIMTSVILNAGPSHEVVARQRASREAEGLGLPMDIASDLAAVLLRGETIRRKPSEILDALLQGGKGAFESFRNSGYSKLTKIYRDVVTHGCAVFIDSLDQALEAQFPGDLEVWRTGQLGLMRASWELTRINHHVKTFVSIRQEAWASFVDPIKNNMAGSTINIKYTDNDLSRIFELAIQKNDGDYSIHEFFGMRYIYNHYIGSSEEIFDFVKRHTVGVPRWLVMLGSEISNIRDGRGWIHDQAHLERHQRAIADTINREAANLAKTYLDAEMRLFFKGSDPVSEVKLLLARVQSTVLTLANISRLNERYLEISRSPIDYPFCLLINLGLIGHSVRTLVSPSPVMNFRMPYEFDWQYEDILPSSRDTLYFLHPCLHQMAQDSNDHFRYYGLRIANKAELSTDDIDRISSRRFNVFISYKSEEWSPCVSNIVYNLEDAFNEAGEFADVWVDRVKMEGARKYLAQMSEANETSEFMVFCASRRSVASPAVLHEVMQRKDRDFKSGKETIFTVIIDDLPISDLPVGLSTDHVLQYDSPSFKISELARQIAERHRLNVNRKGEDRGV